MPSRGHHLAGSAKHILVRYFVILPAGLIPLSLSIIASTPARSAVFSPTPEPDPLAIPVVPENPSDIDLGRISYYYHCMPCHGDKGQGLTNEWRGVWVEDHQDCWARGCHGGKPDDLGFPIPRSVPAVMPPFSSLARFVTPEELTAFLHASHPPQDPGVLAEDECRTLTIYLTQSVPQGTAMQVGASTADEERVPTSGASLTRAMAALAVTLGLAWLIGSKEARPR